MSDPFVAEIRIIPFNFSPKGWAFCNGQLMPISQNTALFALLGTMYGGDGKSTFALPDLQGRTPMQPGQGPGLSDHYQGEAGGDDTVTLTEAQLPTHTHTIRADNGAATSGAPTTQYIAGGNQAFSTGQPNTSLAPSALGTAGGGLPHNNRQPFLTMNFVIALQGIFPPRW